LDLYFAEFFSRSQQSETRFLLLTQALEVYHRVKWRNKKPLRQRLEELVRNHPETLKPIISEPESFAGLVTETRNHFTHWGSPASPIISDDELPAFTDRVRRLLQICILSDIDIPNTAAQRIIAEPLPKVIAF